MATTHPALSTISKTFQIALIGLMLTLTTGSLFAQNSVLTLYHSTEEVQGGRLTLPVEGLAP